MAICTKTQHVSPLQRVPHPLAALQSHEMEVISKVVKAANPSKSIAFRRIYLQEADKSKVVAYLKAEAAKTTLPAPPKRIGQALFYFKGELQFMEALVDIGSQALMSQRVLEGMHGPGDDAEMLLVAKGALASSLVKKELDRLQLPEGSELIAEPWPYGTDDTPVQIRQFQVWFFINSKASKHHPGANFYAHPLDFSAVVDGRDMSVIRIDRMPMTANLEASTDPNARYEVNPDSEYAPEFLPEGPRKDLKPIVISQPEGVSFKVAADGETVAWQKWQFRVNFDLREGIVLRNVTYDGRPIFYRAALSEMTVPYGDPRSPLHRKSAYDLGECGAGQTANNLTLGCDCLGVIHYFNGLGCNHDGEPVVMPNTICMHEQDAGIGSKHTNVRTGRADVTRTRELILQLILTVGNYEYALYWVFDTMGALHFEIRATGIMSVTPVSMSTKPTDLAYGTVVAPGVFAPHHQHIFNFRIDPAIDDYENSAIVYDEVLPMPRDEKNPHGVGFELKTTPVTNESAFNLSWETNRVVRMINTKKTNAFSGKPIGYKLLMPPTQLGLAHETSMHNTRGEFVNNHIHVTKQSDAELYAAGEHPWQSVGGQGGCKTWSSRGRELGSGESVLWATLGFTHTARPEDWPCMPCAVKRIHFEPVGFFERSPAIDMPPSTQAVNQSSKACCQE